VLELRSVRGTGGGPEKTIMLGSKAANPERVQVTVCYLRDDRDGTFALDVWARRLNLDYVEVRERHSFDWSAWRRVFALIRERRIDIVHAHEYKTNALALAASARTAAHALSTVHGWTGASARERWLYYPADKRLLARFPRLIAVSNEIKQELVRHGSRPDAITVLLNAVDASAFTRRPDRRGPARLACGVGPDDLVIGAVGRVERQKRFDVLLQAAAALVPRHPRLKVVIVGTGALLPALALEAERLGIAAHCRWLGHRTDVADLHHAFDLFVQASDYEGTPNAVLEAMAMETPIVATDAGGTRELATPDEHAIVVPFGRPADLAAAIEAVLSDAEGARRRAQAARRRVESDLSFAARTRRLEAEYEALVASSRRRRGPAPATAEGVHRA
jgi:glycosyltransferase involved in cell wall biosynthesis